MDNRAINEIRDNETKLINEIEVLEKENQEYKEVINNLRKILNPERLDLLPFDISEQIICLFEEAEHEN